LHRLRWFEKPPQVTEWWLSSQEPQSVVAAAERAGVPVHSRGAEASRRLADPLGAGVLRTLWAAGAGAGVLAGYGLVVDSQARAAGRRRELAVLHTLGASPTGLGTSMVVEQGLLAGLAVAAGAAVGVATAATMGTALVITPEGAVPVPVPRLVLPVEELVAVPAGLFLAAVGLGALVAWRTRRRVAAQVLRIGDE
jgi:predicted lysophospholipase L1 biosynthesis ABC-type transport system permease subunit